MTQSNKSHVQNLDQPSCLGHGPSTGSLTQSSRVKSIIPSRYGFTTSSQLSWVVTYHSYTVDGMN